MASSKNEEETFGRPFRRGRETRAELALFGAGLPTPPSAELDCSLKKV